MWSATCRSYISTYISIAIYTSYMMWPTVGLNLCEYIRCFASSAWLAQVHVGLYHISSLEKNIHSSITVKWCLTNSKRIGRGSWTKGKSEQTIEHKNLLICVLYEAVGSFVVFRGQRIDLASTGESALYKFYYKCEKEIERDVIYTINCSVLRQEILYTFTLLVQQLLKTLDNFCFSFSAGLGQVGAVGQVG